MMYNNFVGVRLPLINRDMKFGAILTRIDSDNALSGKDKMYLLWTDYCKGLKSSQGYIPFSASLRSLEGDNCNSFVVEVGNFLLIMRFYQQDAFSSRCHSLINCEMKDL